MALRLVAWDFDGVLNRNTIGGTLAWHRDFKADLGADLEGFKVYLFRSGRFDAVLRGARDLRELIAAWIEEEAADLTPEKVLDYWFTKDDLPDDEMLALAETLPCRQIIATNNEPRRAAHIRETAGWGARVDRVFASGEMGVAKPDPAFFARIEDWAGLAPEEILLVDDVAENTRAAEARGWRVFHFTDDSRDGLREILGL